MVDHAPRRVLVAGGGVAGLETLLALRALAGDRVELALVAPDDEFVYRPLTSERPFTVGRARRVPLHAAADAAGAAFVAATVEAVEPEARIVRTSDRQRLDYDALVLAVGAEAMPAVDNALTWDDRSHSELLGGLLRDLEEGYSRSVAIVVPPGPSWPLRGYELALYVALRAGDTGATVQTTIVGPDPPALALLGPGVVESMSRELDRAGVAVAAADHVKVERGHTTTLVLEPSGQTLDVDRVLALPILRGRRLEGVPADDAGFVAIDEHCRVRGVDAVWAAGDATAFPLNSGGFAAEQANVAAADIAAMAGAAIEPRPFEPARTELAGLPSGRHLKAWIAEREGGGLTTDLPLSEVPVLAYLQRDLAAGWRGYG